jgi:hypothetical protein
MRIKLLIAVLSLAAAFALVALVPAVFAQTTPPAAAEKPVAPMKPRAARAERAEEVASKNVSVAEKAQKCLKIEDETNDRLHCYDAAVKPQPNPNPPPVKGIRDCRHIVDVNERLNCFDGFAVQIPKFTH